MFLKMMKKKWKWIVITAAVFAALLGVLYTQIPNPEKSIICYVNDEPVYEPEAAIALSRVELAAKQDYAQASGQEMDKLDYSIAADGQDGYQYLAREVQKELVRAKVIQIEAREHGLCESIAYPEIEKARAQENQKRAGTKEEEGVVYGVVSFDEEEYYRYLIDNLDLQNQRYLIQNGILTADEKEIRSEYDKDPAEYNNEPYDEVSVFVRNVVLSRKYEAYMQELEESATLEETDNIAFYLKKHINQ